MSDGSNRRKINNIRDILTEDGPEKAPCLSKEQGKTGGIRGDRFASDCVVSQESSSNRCVFVVSSHVGIVLELPCVSYPASASVLTGDAKPLGVWCERPPGLLRPFSGCRMWSVSSGS